MPHEADDTPDELEQAERLDIPEEVNSRALMAELREALPDALRVLRQQLRSKDTRPDEKRKIAMSIIQLNMKPEAQEAGNAAAMTELVEGAKERYLAMKAAQKTLEQTEE